MIVHASAWTVMSLGSGGIYREIMGSIEPTVL